MYICVCYMLKAAAIYMIIKNLKRKGILALGVLICTGANCKLKGKKDQAICIISVQFLYVIFYVTIYIPHPASVKYGFEIVVVH